MNNDIMTRHIDVSNLTKYSSECQNKLLQKINNMFTQTQQQLFVQSFYAYLNYNPKTDFVINFDDVWEWCGFSKKGHAKRLFEKYFKENIDYKIALPQSGKRKNEGGHNKETILMTVNAFKKFCMKANTDKADEIHDYYIKLEEILQETINEETVELKLQLEEKEKHIQILKHKPDTEGFYSKTGYIYLIKDISSIH